MQILLPRFGTGIPSIFSGSPMSVQPVAGKLKMAGLNLKQAGKSVKRAVSVANQKALQHAREQASLISVNA